VNSYLTNEAESLSFVLHSAVYVKTRTDKEQPQAFSQNSLQWFILCCYCSLR